VPEARRGRRLDKAGLVGAMVGLALAVAVVGLFGCTGLVLFRIFLFALDVGVRRLRPKQENGGSQQGT
jgi:hypothetical protein